DLHRGQHRRLQLVTGFTREDELLRVVEGGDLLRLRHVGTTLGDRLGLRRRRRLRLGSARARRGDDPDDTQRCDVARPAPSGAALPFPLPPALGRALALTSTETFMSAFMLPAAPMAPLKVSLKQAVIWPAIMPAFAASPLVSAIALTLPLTPSTTDWTFAATLAPRSPMPI